MQCGGPVTFWYGFADPCLGPMDPGLGPMDPDPDPAIFVLDLQDANKNYFCLLCLLLFEWVFK
jgi:hypothetical protein